MARCALLHHTPDVVVLRSQAPGVGPMRKSSHAIVRAVTAYTPPTSVSLITLTVSVFAAHLASISPGSRQERRARPWSARRKA